MINELIVDTLDPLDIPVEYQEYTGEEVDTYITFFTYLDQGEDFSEDEEESTGYYIQIDVWYKKDIGDLCKNIVDIFKGKDFTKINKRDMPRETDTGIYHTVISLFYLEENN
ncbi:MAG: hypothetical protein K0S61_2246 [Anaerocolumna sp.]|jgi:hypothetical protein|nr:hypothetical protein [Anaerocolumna sp.]